MANSLKDKQIIEIKKPNNLVSEYQACGLNSILTILDQMGYTSVISVDEIKSIFDYNNEGISDEQHKFRKLNNYLNESKIPYKFFKSKYTSIQDLYKFLAVQGPVPIFFWMKILDFTKKHYKDMEYQMDFGDVFQTDNKHVLLFVGYDKKGDKIHFIDPSYQLPWIKGDRKPKDYYFSVDSRTFYECTKQLKAVIEVKHSKIDAKRYKKEKTINRKQAKLTK